VNTAAGDACLNRTHDSNDHSTAAALSTGATRTV
jgi:hypothetical protein